MDLNLNQVKGFDKIASDMRILLVNSFEKLGPKMSEVLYKAMASVISIGTSDIPNADKYLGIVKIKTAIASSINPEIKPEAQLVLDGILSDLDSLKSLLLKNV